MGSYWSEREKQVLSCTCKMSNVKLRLKVTDPLIQLAWFGGQKSAVDGASDQKFFLPAKR
jgi:hypothetical protein